MGMFDTAINGVRDFLAGPPDQDPRSGPTATPNMRNVMVGTGEDVSQDVNRGDYGSAAGHALRGTVAMFPAAAHDVLDGPANALAGAVGGNPDVSVADASRAAGTSAVNGLRAFTGQAPLPTATAPAGAPAAAGPAVADGGANPTDARLAGGMQVPAGQTASDVKFGNQQGAAVAGADGVRKFVDGSGRTMYSNVPGDNSEIMAGSKALGIAPGIAPGTGTGGTGGAPAAMDPNTLSTSTGNGPGLGIIGGPNYVSPEQEMAQKFNAQVADENAAKNLSPRQAAQFAAERRGQDMTLAGTRMNNETSRANAQSTNNVSMRGQDLSHDAQMFGHQITGANARARLGYEMGKDRRDFGLRAAQFDQKQNEDNFEQQGKREEQIQKNLESRFTTTDGKGDVVPDRAKIGEYQTAVNATLPAMIKELTDAGTPAALAKAADIRKRGPAALEPGDHDELQQLFDTRNRMIQSRGIGPNAGTAVQSPNLFDYRQLPGAAGVEHRTFGGNRIVTKAGSVSSNDLRYADGPANSILPDSPWKQQTTNLTRGLRTE